ncbi:MAG: FG-GAP repeat domain-containing protein, partial [Candidatus Limnocylindria bacterium]
MFLGATRARVSILAFTLGAASPAIASIDLVGATDATFVWQPASGPVSGYRVYQRCETDGQTLERSVASNRVTLTSAACSAFRVQVAAFSADASQAPGPLSDPSESVRYLPAPPPPPAEDPGGAGDPPPVEPEEPGPAPATRLDFDADGHADVLLHHAARGRLERWAVQPGRLTGRAVLPRISLSARIVGNGDYDGDGFSDLLALDAGQVSVWLLHGASPIGGGPVGEVIGPDGSVEGSGDYDGDGVSDLLVRRPALGRVELWSMSGGQVVAADVLGPDPGPGWRVIGSGDHDADGVSDVLWRSPSEGKLVRWRMLERGRFESRTLTAPVDAGWEGVGVADYDANGCADVLWRNRETGDLMATFYESGEPRATLRR